MRTKILWTHRPNIWQTCCTTWDMMAVTLLSGVQKNGMQANPDKFNFMLFSSTPSEQQALQLCDGTSLMSEPEIPVLGVTFYERLYFSQHIRSGSTKAARQLNALARISKHSNINSCWALYNSIITSNFHYCPLVWHFCGQVNNQKLAEIQERGS